ncbi:hypothetical protein Tco_0833760, partial [Tanacetum coccineum]
FIDLEISTQADEVQSPRVPVPFPKDPYEAIRQACLVETDTESEPFEDLVETETPKSPNAVASPTSLPDSTPPTRHAKESKDSDTSGARSTSSDFTVPLSPDHPLTYTSPTLVLFFRRTACMVVRVPPAMSPGLSTSIAEVAAMFDSTFLEDDKEEDEEEEDEEVEVNLDSNSESDDAEDKGPTIEDEDPVAGDDAVVTPSIVPSPISSPMIPLTVPSPIASPATAEAEGYLIELGAQVEMQGGLIHDHTVRLGDLSPAFIKRYDRDIGELFTRPVLALESWEGQTDAQRAALWHAISDTQIENREL